MSYSRKGHVFIVMKKRHKSPVKWYNFEFLPIIFQNLGHMECYTFQAARGFEDFNIE